MSTPPAPPPPARAPSRWRPRLSLRMLMGLILVAGLVLGWRARRASIQRRAVATVQGLGGRVMYEDQIDPRGFPRLSHRPWGPPWLRRFLGDEYFRDVAWAAFDARGGGRRVDDESIAVVGDFDRLQGLTIRGPSHHDGERPTRLVTATGLARLAGLSRLRVLHLYDIGADAAMLALLPRWPTLEDVTIRDRDRTLPGSSLAPLGKLGRLQVAVVDSVESCAAADLDPLATLEHLRQVIVVRSPTSDAGVGRFGAAASLELLNLMNTEMTEPTLAGLARSPSLASLSFDGSRLPAGGFRALAGLERLKYLDVTLAGRGGEPNASHLIHRVPARFGDADLDALRDVPLDALFVMGLDATDAGVGRLLAAHAFDRLTLGGRGITDASIPALVKQGRLGFLALADTSLTDAGLAQLAALPGLATLALVDNAALTDAGLAGLRSFPALGYLTIRQPGVGPATLDAIRAARSRAGPFNLFEPPEGPPDRVGPGDRPGAGGLSGGGGSSRGPRP